MSQQPPPDPPPKTPPPQSAGPESNPIKLSEILEDWLDYGKDVVGRVSERAKSNAHLIENKSYGRNELLDDLAWFWDQAAKDAAAAAQYLRDKSQAS